MTSILLLDAAGTPQEWVAPRDAALYLCKDLVAWHVGDACTTLRGGTNALTGLQSSLDVPPIVAVRGSVHASKSFRTLSCDRPRLFQRDRFMCAYCGLVYRESELTADHVVPESRGGPWSWTNLVAACRGCNGRKDDRTPEEAGMKLLFVPYEPNRHETFILSNRRILVDQMEWLLHGVPAHSRLRS